MVDGRSLGSYNVAGGFSFKSGDISGTAANMQDDKMGPGTEYGEIPNKEEEQQQNTPFVDRSAQLRATLNSLAMMNVATVLNDRKRLDMIEAAEKTESKKRDKEDLDEEFLNDFDDLHGNQNEETNEKDENNDSEDESY